jgi:NO-binding membrane sensor protein with MHYT domain
MEFTYDPALVALSIAIAILGSFTGLVMTAGIRRIRGPEAALRIALGSIGVGGGVWSMHFVAMLAVILPLELRYEPIQTALSAVLAVIFTAVAFSIVSRNRFGDYTLPVSAAFLGLGIGAMHYLGMNAVLGNCTLTYSWLGVVISIVIAIQASAVALWFAFRDRGLFDTILGAIALGLAIASMHYTAMEATRFLPAQGFREFFGNAFNDRYLALSISIAMYGICGVCITVFSVLTFIRRASAPGDRRATP